MVLREIAKRINYLNVLHRIRIQRAAMKHEMHLGQPPVLEFIAAHDRCTQREAAEWLQVSQPSIAVSVKRMQRTGLLIKESDENDLRITRLSSTEEGRKSMEGCREECDQVDARMFAGFTESELESLWGYLDRLIDNMAFGDLRGKSFFALMETERKMKEERL